MFLDVLRIHLINFVQRCCSVTSSEWMLMMQPEFVDNLLLSLRSKGDINGFTQPPIAHKHLESILQFPRCCEPKVTPATVKPESI